jgi:hypothetical protein
LKFSVECSIPRIGKAMTRTKTAEQSSKFKIRNSKQIQMSKTTKFQNELAGASDAGGKVSSDQCRRTRGQGSRFRLSKGSILDLELRI